jgi:hypothetical protein
MRTIVFQSFRRENVPNWMACCMDSVANWTRARGYEYRFIGDELFDLLPKWFALSHSGRMLPLTDLARLKAAKKYLEEGFTRAVWIDADVLIFDTANFSVETEFGFAFCRELWLEKRWGSTIADNRINNCVSVYERDNSFLNFYIYAAEALARAKGRDLTDWDIGTNLLSTLGRTLPLPLLGNVGMFSAQIVHSLAYEEHHMLAEYGAHLGATLAAGNFCSSAIAKTGLLGADPHALLERAVNVLIAAGGETINRHVKPTVRFSASKSPNV